MDSSSFKEKGRQIVQTKIPILPITSDFHPNLIGSKGLVYLPIYGWLIFIVNLGTYTVVLYISYIDPIGTFPLKCLEPKTYPAEIL